MFDRLREWFDNYQLERRIHLFLWHKKEYFEWRDRVRVEDVPEKGVELSNHKDQMHSLYEKIREQMGDSDVFTDRHGDTFFVGHSRGPSVEKRIYPL